VSLNPFVLYFILKELFVVKSERCVVSFLSGEVKAGDGGHCVQLWNSWQDETCFYCHCPLWPSGSVWD